MKSLTVTFDFSAVPCAPSTGTRAEVRLSEEQAVLAALRAIVDGFCATDAFDSAANPSAAFSLQTHALTMALAGAQLDQLKRVGRAQMLVDEEQKIAGGRSTPRPAAIKTAATGGAA